MHAIHVHGPAGGTRACVHACSSMHMHMSMHLEVAVHDPLGVQVGDARRHLPKEPPRLTWTWSARAINEQSARNRPAISTQSACHLPKEPPRLTLREPRAALPEPPHVRVERAVRRVLHGELGRGRPRPHADRRDHLHRTCHARATRVRGCTCTCAHTRMGCTFERAVHVRAGGGAGRRAGARWRDGSRACAASRSRGCRRGARTCAAATHHAQSACLHRSQSRA